VLAASASPGNPRRRGLLGLGSLAVGSSGVLGGSIAIFGLIAIVQSVLALAFAYGAWTLKPWA